MISGSGWKWKSLKVSDFISTWIYHCALLIRLTNMHLNTQCKCLKLTNVCAAYRALSSFTMACLITTRTSGNMACHWTTISSLAIHNISRCAFDKKKCVKNVFCLAVYVMNFPFLLHIFFQSPQSSCSPYSYDSQNTPIVPCGAIANSMFNGIISVL